MSLNTIKHLLIDMDGVLWRGDQPVPGLTEFFATLRAEQIGFSFMTNNATKTRADYVEKLGHFSVDVEAEQLITSAYSTACWLTEQVPPGSRVHVVGEEGLHTEMRMAGFTVKSGEETGAVEAVAASIFYGIDYSTIHHASRLVREGALYVATNLDATFPAPDGLAPGAGSVIAAISVAAGAEPTVIGKPGPYMYELALKSLGLRPEETAMLGDRLETDILGGQQAGLPTILVLTGVTSAEDLATSDIQPTWVFDSIAELAAALDRHD
jgi:4-nitrophenyl phosphatase